MITVVSVREHYPRWKERVGRGFSTTVYTTSYHSVVVVAADARAKRFGVTERRSSDGGGVPVPPSPPRIWIFRVVQ